MSLDCRIIQMNFKSENFYIEEKSIRVTIEIIPLQKENGISLGTGMMMGRVVYRSPRALKSASILTTCPGIGGGVGR